MKLTIDLPNVVAEKPLSPDYLQQALVATLYHTGHLSEREACEALGMTRREFEELLPRFGFSILTDTDDYISHELRIRFLIPTP